HHRLRAFQRALAAPQRNGLHRGNAEQANAEYQHRHHDFDQADAAHLRSRRRAATATTIEWDVSTGMVGHGQVPPPSARVWVRAPLIITVVIRRFSAGLLTGRQTVTVACEAIAPEGRNTMPAAGPLTWTEPPGVSSRITSSVPVALSWPWTIQRVQVSLLVQARPSSLAHTVTRALRRM